MKKSLFKGKSLRTKVFTAITLGGILLLFGLNLLLTYFSQLRLWYADATPEGFYSLSPEMESACSAILDPEDGEAPEITVTFCTDPDYLVASGAMRPAYYMALALQKRYSNFTVKTVNVTIEPAAVSIYKTTSMDVIDARDMIISYGNKFRVVDATSFWTENNFSYNGEYRFVSILSSLTAIKKPVAYFSVGHGESIYDPENPNSEESKSLSRFAELLSERGMTVKTLDISTVDRIPEDCALLIINCPTEDFLCDPTRFDEFNYVSDLEKLDRYLVGESGAIIFNKGYGVSLPNIESFLYEWGIGFGDGVVKDRDNCLENLGESGSAVLGVYDTDENSFGSAYYGDFAALQSSPKMVFTDTGYVYCSYGDSDAVSEPGSYGGQRVYSHFIGSSATSVAYETLGSTVLTDGEGAKTLAAVTTRTFMNNYTAETGFSYLFAANSEKLFTNEVLGNPSYANYSVFSTLIANISRTERYASIELGGTSLNSPKYGGKHTMSTTLSNTSVKVYSSNAKEVIAVNKGISSGDITLFSVLIYAVPTVILLAGITVFIRRKFL